MINFAQVIYEDKGNSSKLLDILLKIEKKYFDCFKIIVRNKINSYKVNKKNILFE